MGNFIRVRVHVRHLVAAINALLFHGDHLHESARKESKEKQAQQLRQEAEDAFMARKSLWEQGHLEVPNLSFHDESITGNHAPVQHNRMIVSDRGANYIALALVGIVSGFALAISVNERSAREDQYGHLHDQLLRDERAFEQARIQLLSQNAMLQREGFVRPGDEWMGPEGNLQFNPSLLLPKKER